MKLLQDLKVVMCVLQEGFMAEDDFGAHDDYQRERDEEAELEAQRVQANQLNAAENVAGITLMQEGGLSRDVLQS